MTYQSTQNFTQVQTIFGAGYVPDAHGDETHRNLAIADQRGFVADFGAVMEALRAALSL
jgi:hypothetical protein